MSTALLNYFYFSFSIGALVVAIAGTTVLISNKKLLLNRIWFLLSIVSALWSFGYFIMISANSLHIANYGNYLLHTMAIFIGPFFLHFITLFTQTDKQYRQTIYASYTSCIFLILLLFTTDKFIAGTQYQRFLFKYNPEGGNLFFLFATHYWWNVLLATILLIQKLKYSTGEYAQQLRYVLFAGSLGFIGGGPTFFYSFGINIAPYAIILFPLYPVIITYAIMKHQLFNVKVVATEILTFLLWITLLTRTILSSSTQDRIFNSGLLVATVVIGVLLIRSVLKEVKTREKVEKLADQLANANEQLIELNRQKTEFLSIASHQFRTPLTAIKGYSSMLLEGSFGKLPKKIHEAVDRVYQSSEHLVLVIDDFLNVSRIELGKMRYTFAVSDFRALVKEVIALEQPSIEKSKLDFTYLIDNQSDFTATFDKEKLQQVLFNLIENSIKYTPKGSITISLAREGDRLHFSIKDTGIGVSKLEQSKLFKKYSRVQESNHSNITGTGLGLYVAKEILDAHNGNIWMESEGEGKGSIFHVELTAGEQPELLKKSSSTSFSTSA